MVFKEMNFNSAISSAESFSLSLLMLHTHGLLNNMVENRPGMVNCFESRFRVKVYLKAAE